MKLHTSTHFEGTEALPVFEKKGRNDRALKSVTPHSLRYPTASEKEFLERITRPAKVISTPEPSTVTI